MTDPSPAEPVADRRRRWWIPRPSIVWLIPLIALALSLAVAYNSYSSRGPLIEIVFNDASGVTVGETTVRFKDYPIGIVEAADFSEDLRQVVVSVRLNREAAEYVDENAQFWLVSAQVGPRGITGIETVLSGVYIAAAIDADRGPHLDRYYALDEPPLTPLGQPGVRIALRAPDGGSLARGAPILFKQIRVGQVEAVDLTEAGDVVITGFIDAPNDARITTATRFWNVSGFTVELSTAGAALRVDSLASLFEGGIAFDTISSGGEPVEDGHSFDLYASESNARSSVLGDDGSAETVPFSVVFEGSVRGLSVGADVEYRGIRVGEVTGVQARVVDGAEGPSVQIFATLQIRPNRLGVSEGDVDPASETLDLIEAAVARGMRAQLRATGLLASTLMVRLTDVPDAAPATLDRDAEPFPQIPSVPTDEGDLMASATGIIDRVQALPIEDVVDEAVALLASVTALINDESVRSAPENLGLLIADIRELVEESGIEEVPAELTAVLASVRMVVEEAAGQQLASELAAAIAEGQEALATVNAALPGVIERVEGATGQLQDLALEDVVAAARQLVENVDTLVQTELAPLPDEVSAVIGEIRLLLAEFREGGATENVNASLASLREVTDDLAAAQLAQAFDRLAGEAQLAVQNISAASAEAPALVASLTQLSDQAAALPLEDLAARAATLLDDIDALINSEAVAGVPVEVEASLREVRAILTEFRSGGTPENITATVASVRRVADDLAAADLAAQLGSVAADTSRAATNVSTASEELPALIDELTRLSQRAADLPLEDLVASSTATLDGLEAFLANEGLADVPPRLAATLAETEAILAELRAGGAVDNVNATLASADAAADAVTSAAAELPALVEQLSQTAARADAALSSVGPGSEINRDTLLLLREVREAARAVNALVSALERRPNALLFGR